MELKTFKEFLGESEMINEIARHLPLLNISDTGTFEKVTLVQLDDSFALNSGGKTILSAHIRLRGIPARVEITGNRGSYAGMMVNINGIKEDGKDVYVIKASGKVIVKIFME